MALVHFKLITIGDTPSSHPPIVGGVRALSNLEDNHNSSETSSKLGNTVPTLALSFPTRFAALQRSSLSFSPV